MPMRDEIPRRTLAYEDPGTVDGPFDDDARSGVDPLIRSDAACAIPWTADGHQAIQVFVDPAIVDRAGELCARMNDWSSVHRDLDSLSAAVIEYARGEGLSAAVHEDLPDDLSVGTVAIAFTVG
jgi:hypothetical protein